MSLIDLETFEISFLLDCIAYSKVKGLEGWDRSRFEIISQRLKTTGGFQ